MKKGRRIWRGPDASELWENSGGYYGIGFGLDIVGFTFLWAPYYHHYYIITIINYQLLVLTKVVMNTMKSEDLAYLGGKIDAGDVGSSGRGKLRSMFAC